MAKYSLGNAFTNWDRSDLSLADKIRLTAKNQAIKARNRTGCCGNHGEPGC